MLFQQYYQGVPVENGGFTSQFDIPGGPCGDGLYNLVALSPYVFTGIEVNTTPRVEEDELPALITDAESTTHIYQSELLISHGLTDQCNYNLVYRTMYSNRAGTYESWVDAHTGDILKIVEAMNHHTAPTQHYGTVTLNDWTQNGVTSLITPPGSLSNPEGRVRVFDFTEFTESEENQTPCKVPNAVDYTIDKIPTTPNASQWTVNDFNRQAMYQAFFVATEAHNAYSEFLDLDFTNVEIGVNCLEVNAVHFGYGDFDETTFISIGFDTGVGDVVPGPKSLASRDIVAHEMGHSFVNEFFSSGNDINFATMHEGVSDVLAHYIESRITGVVTWQLNSEIPGLEAGLYRDPSDPATEDCVTNVINETSQHARAAPFMVWFYRGVQDLMTINGAAEIENLHIMTEIVIDAMPLFSGTATYQSVQSSTIQVIEERFGICSEEANALRENWNNACLTGPGACKVTISGPNQVCSDDNTITFCANFEVDPELDEYRWTIIGSQSTEYETTGDQQGNVIYDDQCLSIIGVPEYDYYPVSMKVKVYSPAIGAEYIATKSFKIVDCSGAPPEDPCDKTELAQLPSTPTADTQTTRSSDASEPLVVIRSQVFDLTGRPVAEVNRELASLQELDLLTGIYLIRYLDATGTAIRTTKFFHQAENQH